MLWCRALGTHHWLLNLPLLFSDDLQPRRKNWLAIFQCPPRLLWRQRKFIACPRKYCDRIFNLAQRRWIQFFLYKASLLLNYICGGLLVWMHEWSWPDLELALLYHKTTTVTMQYETTMILTWYYIMLSYYSATSRVATITVLIG